MCTPLDPILTSPLWFNQAKEWTSQFLSSLSLKSSLAWAPLLSVLFSAECKVTFDWAMRLWSSNASTRSVLKTRDLSLLKAGQEKAEIVIFDDGLQEKTINYDLKIVCFNSLKLDGNGLVIPAGPLRERLNSIKNYDIVLINGNTNKESKNFIDKIKNINPNIRIFTAKYVPKNFSNLKKKNFFYSVV